MTALLTPAHRPLPSLVHVVRGQRAFSGAVLSFFLIDLGPFLCLSFCFLFLRISRRLSCLHLPSHGAGNADACHRRSQLELRTSGLCKPHFCLLSHLSARHPLSCKEQGHLPPFTCGPNSSGSGDLLPMDFLRSPLPVSWLRKLVGWSPALVQKALLGSQTHWCLKARGSLSLSLTVFETQFSHAFPLSS